MDGVTRKKFLYNVINFLLIVFHLWKFVNLRFIFAFLLIRKENVTTKPKDLVFLTFETEKKYVMWIFFKSNEFKKLIFFLQNGNIIHKHFLKYRRRRVRKGVLIKIFFLFSWVKEKNQYIVSQTFVTLDPLTENMKLHK